MESDEWGANFSSEYLELCASSVCKCWDFILYMVSDKSEKGRNKIYGLAA